MPEAQSTSHVQPQPRRETPAARPEIRPAFTIKTNIHPRLDAISVLDPRGRPVAAIERSTLAAKPGLTEQTICDAFSTCAQAIAERTDGTGFVSPREAAMLRTAVAETLKLEVKL